MRVCVYACVCVCVSSGGLFEAPPTVSLVLSRKRLSAHWMSSSRCSANPAGCVRAGRAVDVCARGRVSLCLDRMSREGGRVPIRDG